MLGCVVSGGAHTTLPFTALEALLSAEEKSHNKPLPLRAVQTIPFMLRKSVAFAWRVVRRFFGQNRGFLLAGAVGYNALLSLIPLFAVLLIGLSSIFDDAVILQAVTTELRWLLPGQEAAITEVLRAFLEDRNVVGTVGIGVMLFFSSITFRILEDAFSVVFEHHHDHAERSFLVSALIPYLFIGSVGASLALLTIATGVLDTYGEHILMFFGLQWSQELIGPWITRGIGTLAMALLMSSIYIVMPTARIQFKRAIGGGLIAAILWEIVRSVLVWYFDNLSLVNVVYGSLATVIIVLLSMEIVAIVILLGAQVIAELERAERLDLPWWANPDNIDPKLEESLSERRAKALDRITNHGLDQE